MAYNTTLSLEKLNCTNYVDFSKCQDKFRQISWSKNDSNYLDVKFKVFKKDDNKEFRLVQNLTVGEANFQHFMRLRKQLVIAAENLAGEGTLSPVLTPTLFKDKDDQLKLSHKVVDVMDRAKKKDFFDSVAFHSGQAREFQSSIPIIFKEEGGWEVSSNCSWELETWKFYLFTWSNDFCRWQCYRY